MPSYDDWESVHALLPRLDDELLRAAVEARVLIIDDGSQTRCPSDLPERGLRAISQVGILSLKRNLGHQRALCIGLCVVSCEPSWSDCDGVVLMDADGEDSPSDVPRLIKHFLAGGGRKAVFASRLRRSEGVAFRVFYHLYRLLHRLLTGIPVRIGNFSVLSIHTIQRLTVSSELWNHYAAAVVQAKVPMAMVPVARARRLFGTSRMNFVSLVSHGLGAMSVFGDRIGVRSLIVTLLLMTLLALGSGVILGIRFLTPLAIPGWATTALGVVAILLLQSLLLSLLFTFLIHLGRAGSSFLPARDYTWFVESLDTVWSADDRL
jgi:hypothetical protein